MTKDEEAQIIKQRQANCTQHPRAFVRDPYHSLAQCAFCGMTEKDYVALWRIDPSAWPPAGAFIYSQGGNP